MKKIMTFLKSPVKFVRRRLLVGRITSIESGPDMGKYKIAKAVIEDKYPEIYEDPYLLK